MVCKVSNIIPIFKKVTKYIGAPTTQKLPKATHQDGFLKGHIVGNGWLFFK